MMIRELAEYLDSVIRNPETTVPASFLPQLQDIVSAQIRLRDYTEKLENMDGRYELTRGQQIGMLKLFITKD